MNILIDGAGTATAISVLKGISQQDRHECKTFILDTDPFNVGRYLADKFYPCPRSDDDLYVGFVLDICEKDKIDIFVPIMDNGFANLAKYRDWFGNTLLLLADKDAIAICDDKYETHRFFKKHMIPTPKTFDVFKFSHFPTMIMKPRRGGRASIGVHEIRDRRDFMYYSHENDNFIMQQKVEGTEFTADVLTSLNGTHYIGAIVRERVETKGGLSVKSRVVPSNISAIIKEHVEIIVTTLRLPGASNIQGFYNDDGVVFTEINPRFAGTHAHTITAGMNSIAYIMDMYNGVNPEDIEITTKQDVEMIRYWNELFVERNTQWTNSVKRQREKIS
ncbi:MAG: ATP-grasp domain-containing protein [Candidatus Thorarchaeota archaeon]|jgi:carbamoyl-phosphate synthase large subunit